MREATRSKLTEALRDETRAPANYRKIAASLKGKVPKSDLNKLRSIARQESRHRTAVRQIRRDLDKNLKKPR